jgi:hypothetical protein
MSDENALELRRRADVIVRTAFARLDTVALAVATGTLGGLALFSATAWLLLLGAPPVSLLAHYLPGYSVTWSGSLLGIAYGFAVGCVAGASIGAFWNGIHHIYLLVLGRGYPFGGAEL